MVYQVRLMFKKKKNSEHNSQKFSRINIYISVLVCGFTEYIFRYFIVKILIFKIFIIPALYSRTIMCNFMIKMSYNLVMSQMN